jgi:hypothetical protein
VNARRCTAQESAELTAHLRTDDNAKGYVPIILDGRLTPWLGTIVGRDALGALSTLFVNLGAQYAAKLHGRPRFLVREAREVWRQAKCDEAKFALLERYLEDERAGRLANRTITAVDTGAELVIVDGNKRAIAIYEASGAELELPVFVLRPSR